MSPALTALVDRKRSPEPPPGTDERDSKANKTK
jgi:hypothetical protein